MDVHEGGVSFSSLHIDITAITFLSPRKFSSMTEQVCLASREGMPSFIDVMLDLDCVADQGHSRLFGAVCGAFTHNKVAFKELVLGKFVGPNVSRKYLR